MIGKKEISNVQNIYYSIFSSLNKVLIGQENVKKVVTASLLSDINSKMLFMGDTGMGKTSLTKYLASSFNFQRISVTSDMIPSEIVDLLKEHTDMNFLQIDEFNRASGKVQSTFLELMAESQMTVAGKIYPFSDFYVVATQNSQDISGVFNVPMAIYDRFDVCVSFDDLTEEDKMTILFNGFEPEEQSNIDIRWFYLTKRIVDNFLLGENDKYIMMQIFSKIDEIKYNSQKLFAGSNIRAHKFALKLMKLNALKEGRNYIVPADILDYLNSIYMHRINQNLLSIGDPEVQSSFECLQEQILSMKRKRG